MSCRSFYEEDWDREEKRTPRHSSWETVEGEGSDIWVGILNQNYTEFTVLLQKYSASRLSLFPAAPVWAYANKASQARAQRKRSCTITRGLDWQERQTEARKLALEGLLWPGDHSRWRFPGFPVLWKSSMSPGQPVKPSLQTHTAPLGPCCMAWRFCDYGWLVYQCGHERAQEQPRGKQKMCEPLLSHVAALNPLLL